MKKDIIVLSALFSLIFLLASPQLPGSRNALIDAERSFAGHEIEAAAALFAEAAEKSESAADRVKAAGQLAMIEWRFRNRPEQARAIIEQALRLELDQADLLLELSRLETAGGDFAEARKAAFRALLFASDPAVWRKARLAWAETVVEQAMLVRRSGQPETPGGLLEDAALILRSLAADETGSLTHSRLTLQCALLRGDGPGALAGWRSYFRVNPGDQAYPLLRAPQKELEEILPTWRRGHPNSARLVNALTASRMFAEAALVVRDPLLDQQFRDGFKAELAYADLLSGLSRICDDYYRRTAIGKTSEVDLLRPLMTEIASHWQVLEIPGEPPSEKELREISLEVIPENFINAVRHLQDHWGCYINLGHTAGYFDLHMGHVVSDETRLIEQYGQSSRIRFVLLDLMVSNGFQSWAWLYRSQHGGWANPRGIYQVRPAYTDGPIRDWRRLSDPGENASWNEEIQRQSLEDLERIKGPEPVYLPGLAGRMRRGSLNELLAELKAQELDKEQLRTRFLAELEQATQDSSIFAHEGRHVIDQALGISDGAELEFRAKLSEIAFARLPGLALAGAVITPSLGNDTPHGRANQRILEGYLDWMEINRAEIAGLDPDLPLLPQLDLLSSGQLRTAAREMDPLAASHVEDLE